MPSPNEILATSNIKGLKRVHGFTLITIDKPITMADKKLKVNKSLAGTKLSAP